MYSFSNLMEGSIISILCSIFLCVEVVKFVRAYGLDDLVLSWWCSLWIRVVDWVPFEVRWKSFGGSPVFHTTLQPSKCIEQVPDSAESNPACPKMDMDSCPSPDPWHHTWSSEGSDGSQCSNDCCALNSSPAGLAMNKAAVSPSSFPVGPEDLSNEPPLIFSEQSECANVVQSSVTPVRSETQECPSNIETKFTCFFFPSSELIAAKYDSSSELNNPWFVADSHSSCRHVVSPCPSADGSDSGFASSCSTNLISNSFESQELVFQSNDSMPVESPSVFDKSFSEKFPTEIDLSNYNCMFTTDFNAVNQFSDDCGQPWPEEDKGFLHHCVSLQPQPEAPLYISSPISDRWYEGGVPRSVPSGGCPHVLGGQGMPRPDTASVIPAKANERASSPSPPRIYQTVKTEERYPGDFSLNPMYHEKSHPDQRDNYFQHPCHHARTELLQNDHTSEYPINMASSAGGGVIGASIQGPVPVMPHSTISQASVPQNSFDSVDCSMTIDSHADQNRCTRTEQLQSDCDLDFVSRWPMIGDLLKGFGEPFKGDQDCYPIWKHRLNHMISLAKAPPLIELMIMSNNTGDRPKEIVDRISTHAKDPAKLVKKAWRELDWQYDHPLIVANTMLDKLYATPKINETDSSDVDFPAYLDQLRDLAEQCKLIKRRMEHYPELKILDSHWGINLISNKMPGEFKADLRNEFYDVLKTGQFISFKQFVKFLNRYVRILCQPFFHNVCSFPASPFSAPSSPSQAEDDLCSGTQAKSCPPAARNIVPLMSMEFPPSRWLPCWHKFVKHSSV